MGYALAGVILIGVVNAVLAVWIARGLRRLTRVEDRLERLADALSLLTETAESGFSATALEIGRLANAAPRRAASSRTTTRRVTRAAQKGRTVAQIAEDEQVAESEVRLRLHLADHAVRGLEAKETSDALCS